MSIDRRAFIRSLTGQAVRSVGAAIALSGQVRQELAGQLLEEPPVQGAPAVPPAAVSPEAPGAFEPATGVPPPPDALTLGAWSDQPALSSALTGAGSIEAVDQRALPGDVVIVTLESVGEVVHAIRDGVIDGGLAIAQVAAQAVAMAALRASSGPETSRVAIVLGAARALAGVRPDVPLIREALLVSIADLDGTEAPSAEELRRAAGAREETVRAEHRAIASAGAAWLRERFGSRADIMLVGEFGPAATGSIGTTSAVLRAAAESGMEIRVWMPDGDPAGRGAALLRDAVGAAPIDLRPFADAHLNRVMTDHNVRLVMLGASWARVDGTIAGQLGGVAAALVARERGIPVLGVASRSMFLQGRHGLRPAAASRAPGAVRLERVDGRLVDLILTDAGAVGAGTAGRSG